MRLKIAPSCRDYRSIRPWLAYGLASTASQSIVPLAGRVAFENATPPLRSGLSNVPSSFARPSLRCGAVFVLRTRSSSKSEGGLRASNFADLSAKFHPKWRATSDKTTDRPGRVCILLNPMFTRIGGFRTPSPLYARQCTS
jgi:hypothetical protein